MERATDSQVRERAGNQCEYCRVHQRFRRFKFPIDHIVARQHGGGESSSNLALSCSSCNSHKGPNIAGLDPLTGDLTRLFNPRTDRWADHFFLNGPFIEGSTTVGRTTIHVLAMNEDAQIDLRRAIIDEIGSLD